MTAIPLLHGVVANENADFSVSLPLNLEPVSTEQGISNGYLRSAMGAASLAIGPGPDRGGIVWNGVLYRVMGSKLVSVSSAGTIAVIGDVGTDGAPVALDYGFGRLAIGSAGKLWYWDGTTLSQVTDPDLGPVVDMIWMSGYYISTDGTSIVVTQLNDPMSVNPLKYGSAEDDPDPVLGLYELHGELIALGSESIDFFSEIGGSGFPFQLNTGATIAKGCCGTHAKAPFLQTLAFVGSGRNEALGVHIVGSGAATKISTRAVDDALSTVVDPTAIQVETRVMRNEERLYIHLPDQSFVYLPGASTKVGEPIWYRVGSGISGGLYRPRNAVFAYGKWICGDAASAALGTLDEGVSTHFGQAVGWQINTLLIYNKANGGILHSAELVGLPGRATAGEAPLAFLSLTRDGETYGPERACSTGKRGDRARRVQWRPHARFGNYIGLRIRGQGGLPGWAALEAEIEPLSV